MGGRDVGCKVCKVRSTGNCLSNWPKKQDQSVENVQIFYFNKIDPFFFLTSRSTKTHEIE